MFFNFSSARKTDVEKVYGSDRFQFLKMPIAGVKVTEDKAFRYSAYFACVKILSETIAYLPWHVHQQGSRRKAFTDHPLDNVLYRKPNPEQNSFLFKETMISRAVSRGNFYSEIERSRMGDVISLWPIDTDRVQMDRDSRRRLMYEINNDAGANTVLSANDVFHVRGPSRDGVTGMSVLEYARESIAIGLAAEAFGASFFGNNAIPGTVITNDGTVRLDEGGVRNLLAEWNKKLRGPEKNHRAHYLEKGLDFKVIGISPDDAKFIETLQYGVLEMCRFFRMPPHKLAELARTTHNNIESQNIEFVTDAIMPWVSRSERESDFRLLDGEPGVYTKINVLGLLRGDSKSRMEYYKGMSGLGAMDIDEIRDAEDMDPLEEHGDLRIVPANMTTLERMKTGNTGQTSRRASDNMQGLFEEVATRFCRLELTHAKRCDATTNDNEIVNFYVGHAKSCANGFYRVSQMLCDLLEKDCDVNAALQNFFGTYCSDSADALKNALVADKMPGLLSSWDASKAPRLARDLIVYLKGV